MNVVLTPHQELAILEVMRALNGETLKCDNVGVLLVGPPGVGMSTCINEVKAITNRKFIVLQAIDFKSVGCLGRWLGNILGLDDVRVSINIKISPPLVAMLNVIGVSMLILEDAHDIDRSAPRPNTLHRVIEEFSGLKSRIPKMKFLMTIGAAELSCTNLSVSNLSEIFTVVRIPPMTFSDLNFLLNKYYLNELDGLPFPLLSERALMSIWAFSQGSVGRAMFILELLKHYCACSGNVQKNDTGIINFISRLEGRA